MQGPTTMSPFKQALIQDLCVPALHGVRAHISSTWLQLRANHRTDNNNKTRFEIG